LLEKIAVQGGSEIKMRRAALADSLSLILAWQQLCMALEKTGVERTKSAIKLVIGDPPLSAGRDHDTDTLADKGLDTLNEIKSFTGTVGSWGGHGLPTTNTRGSHNGP